MQSIRLRILVTCAVVLAAAVGGWQLLPSEEESTATITVGTTDVVTSLDPAGAYDAGSWAMYSNVYQSLLTFKPNGVTPVPDAARDCDFVGLTLQTFQCELRDDLTFANGRKITGEDVKYSFERMLRIKTDVGPQPLFSTLKNVTARGQTVTFNLRTRDATFPQKVATGAGSIVDRSQYPDQSLREGESVDGSGPYLLKQYEPGVRARLVPNPRYKGALTKTGGPVLIRYFEGSDQLAEAWKAGQVDVTHRQLPAKLIAGLDPGDSSMRVSVADTAEIRNLVFNVRPGSPMAKKAVRQAVAWVIDRPKVVTSVYHATVQPLYSLIPQGTLGHTNPFFDAYPQPSAKQARELLDDAGIRTPVSFTLVHRADSGPAQEAAELRRQLEATGLFKVKVVAVDWKVFQKGYGAGKYDAYTLGWIPDFPDPDNFTQPLVGKDSTLHSGYESKTVDSLIASTQQYGERPRATNDFKSIQREIAVDVPLVPLWQKKDYVLSSGDISGAQYLSDGTGVWRLWELGWI
ncbi:ABC transporter substrate-binding protein [Streptomyces sp. NPDC029004]|uniref:ABC transporter substrate-binding protein n=1 Tax=Streptomyces sp. NPDC029004 TaxID=3154490 RepID=UPI0033CBC60A